MPEGAAWRDQWLTVQLKAPNLDSGWIGPIQSSPGLSHIPRACNLDCSRMMACTRDALLNPAPKIPSLDGTFGYEESLDLEKCGYPQGLGHANFCACLTGGASVEFHYENR